MGTAEGEILRTQRKNTFGVETTSITFQYSVYSFVGFIAVICGDDKTHEVSQRTRMGYEPPPVPEAVRKSHMFAVCFSFFWQFLGSLCGGCKFLLVSPGSLVHPDPAGDIFL